MEAPLDQQDFILTVTIQIETMELIDGVLKPSPHEKQQNVTGFFKRYDLYLEQGLITPQTHERVVNLWLDTYLPTENLPVNS